MSPRLKRGVRAVDEDTTDPQVIPYLLYADAGAAMDWLVLTFGFIERARDTRNDGSTGNCNSTEAV